MSTLLRVEVVPSANWNGMVPLTEQLLTEPNVLALVSWVKVLDDLILKTGKNDTTVPEDVLLEASVVK